MACLTGAQWVVYGSGRLMPCWCLVARTPCHSCSILAVTHRFCLNMYPVCLLLLVLVLLVLLVLLLEVALTKTRLSWRFAYVHAIHSQCWMSTATLYCSVLSSLLSTLFCHLTNHSYPAMTHASQKLLALKREKYMHTSSIPALDLTV